MIRSLINRIGLARETCQPLSQMVIRKYSPRGRPLSANPGIGHRMKIFEKDQLDDEFDDLDDMESDFMNVHKSHKEVRKEVAEHKDKLGSWIVKDKYFKSQSLNLLTYSEKEQIRHLHDSDREEWTAEKLAGSFPATEETIGKIIKAKWLIRDSKRVEQHDSKVQQNWDSLRQGNVPGINEELRKHLLKFADRDIDHVPSKETKRNLLELPAGEFSQIITSCKKMSEPLAIKAFHNEPDSRGAAPMHTASDYGSNTIVLDGVSDRRPMTIELFRDSSGMLQPNSPPLNTTPATVNHVSTALGSRTGKVEMMPVPSQFNANKKMFELQDQITIPRKLRRHGATYKVDDSYFDEDGEFLYRVPGMKK